jgi:hypothetical protein
MPKSRNRKKHKKKVRNYKQQCSGTTATHHPVTSLMQRIKHQFGF